MITESELQAQYDAAVKRLRDAEQGVAAALKEMNKKEALAKKKQKSIKEYYLAWSEKQKVEVAIVEKYEQEYAAEYAKNLCYTDWMKNKHGTDSKEAQIAQHRGELSRTRDFVYFGGSLYSTKWYKLYCKVWWVYYQLKAEGYGNIAAELNRAREVFCHCIEKEANGKTFDAARKAAFAALDKWEKENDREEWDEAKSEYDAALAKWNEFKPEGDQYAEELRVKIYECAKKTLKLYGIADDFDIAALKKELSRKSQKIDDLEDQLSQKGREIGELHGRTNELEATVGEMRIWMESLIRMNQALINGQYKQIEESEAFARTTLEQEWQFWFERATSSHLNWLNWIQERMPEIAALEEEEATARNKYRHEFYDSVQNIDNRHVDLQEMLSGWVLD
ncbi:uncharacterized protein TM35_000012370 [Trypanosoma theileri]|uniref:Uncharacterized protein n=1 Tax=Trypanosoma theileri TaxID=67003 RepID=A0A1X0PA80_9TRYP|nr:uncharacterized protein TM35_000012370 [Trypanosoma theileri]ORC93360.1 hypothetical protein TM35_000012370 [Trypanosoma theileri]